MAETVHQHLDMSTKHIHEALILFCESPKVWHIHLNKLDKLLSNETDVTLESKYYSSNELRVLEYGNALVSALFLVVLVALSILVVVALEVALVQDQIKQIYNVDLHCIVLFLDYMEKCVD